MIKALLTSTAAIAISLSASADSNYFGDGVYVSPTKWQNYHSEDVMTDTVTHYAAISSLTEPEYSWETPLEIVYTCTTNADGTGSHGLYFAQKNSFFSVDSTTAARIRIEDQDVKNISGVRIPDKDIDYIFIAGTQNINAFLTDMVRSSSRGDHESFYLQFPEFLDGQPQLFVTYQAEEAINQARTECGLPVVTPLGPEVGIY